MDANGYQHTIQRLLILFGIIAAAGAVARILPIEAKFVDRIDQTTLLYLAVAGALLLLRNVKSLKIGDLEIAFAEAVKLAKEAKLTAENAQIVALGTGKSEERAEPIVGDEAITPGPHPDDPWRDRFGSQSIVGNRKLDADVTEVPGTRDLFRVRLRVASTNPNEPLTGVVQFFLHPTFTNARPIIPVGPTGVAELVLRAWGCFTVGAVADQGRTKLELNLCALQSAPLRFRSR